MTVRVKVRARGPLVIEPGDEPLELYGPDGERRNIDGRPRLMLCRCGASASKPFCDGSHLRIGFECKPQEEPAE